MDPASKEPPRLALTLLGRFSASADSGAPLGVVSARSRALLAYLALQPVGMETRGRLADLFWGERGEAQARQSLRQSLLTLRRELIPLGDDLLVTGRDHVELRLDRVETDAREFARLADLTQADAAERAAALYRGEFGRDLAHGPASFAEWVTAERARFASMAMRVLEVVARGREAEGRGRDAIVAAERLVGLDPLREDSQRLLLELHARHAGRDAALAHARSLAALLKADPGVEPDRETAALVERIRDGSLRPDGRLAQAEDEGEADGAPLGRAWPEPRSGDERAEAVVQNPVPIAPAVAHRRLPVRLFAYSGMAIVALLAVAALSGVLTPGDASGPPTAEAPPGCVVEVSRGATQPDGARGRMTARPGATCRFVGWVVPESAIPPTNLAVTQAPARGRASVSGNEIAYTAGAVAGEDRFVVEGGGARGELALPFKITFMVAISGAAGPKGAAVVDGKRYGRSAIYPLAVLALKVDGASDEGARGFAASVADRLASDLAQVGALRVVSRDSTRPYGERAVDVGAIGAELGVRYVVEGSVRRQGERLALALSLTDAEDRLLVWSDRLQHDGSDTASPSDETFRRIVRQINLAIVGKEDFRRPNLPLPELAVDDLMAKGWGVVLRMSAAGGASRAAEYFGEVLRREPGHSSASVGLGAYHVMSVRGLLVPEADDHLRRARELLEPVLARWPRSTARYQLAVLQQLSGEWAAAHVNLDGMLGFNEAFAPAYAQRGYGLVRLGQLEQGLDQLRYAMRISPYDPAIGPWTVYVGQIELERGDDAAALASLERAVAMIPKSPLAHATLAAAYALRGDATAAARHGAECRRLAPWATAPEIVRRVGLWPSDLPRSRLVEGLALAFGAPP